MELIPHKKFSGLPFCLLFCFLSLAQAPQENTPTGPSMGFGESEGVVNEIWLKAGIHYSKLLLEGPSVADYAAIGELFLSESYPKHASFYFELASAIDSNNVEVKEAYKKAQERLNYLEERYHNFSVQAGTENDPTFYGRLAAIRFHLGDRREGIKILKNALVNFNQDARLMPLVGSFQKQMQVEGHAAQTLYDQFQKALEEKDAKLATNLLGQINYLTLGHAQVLVMIEMAEKVFSEKLNVESVQIVKEFVNQFNQIDLPTGK